MKRKTLAFAIAFSAILVLFTTSVAFAVESGEFQALLMAEQYEIVVSMCESQAAEIAASPDSAEILSVCAQAKAALAGGGAAPAAPPVPETPAPPAMPETPAVPETPAAPPAPAVPAAPAPLEAAAPAAPAPLASTPAAPAAPVPATTYVPLAPGSRISLDMFLTPLRAMQYEQVNRLCEEHKSKIMDHADRDQILKACGEAKIGSYEKSKQQTQLTGAMKDLKKSLKARYDNVASFDLGMARIRTIDTIPKETQKLDEERKAILEMWEAIVMRHALENFKEAVSDQIIIWTIGNKGEGKPGYADVLIERVLKNEGNTARLRWLSARIRMLTDRYTEMDPNKGENEVRKNNLETVKFWMTELYEKTYFDNQILVGMYKYKADRHQEQYDQTDATNDEFHKALYFYGEALKRANSKKALATLYRDIGYLCSRYRSEDKDRLIEFYKKGFHAAKRGLSLMRSVNRVRQELGKSFYRFEEDNADLTAKLQKAYGNNLTGFIYNLFLAKDYRSVVSLKNVTLDTGFDWENKFDVLLIFAESAREMAAASIDNEVAYRRYREMCLAGGNRAFKFVLKRFGGKAPAGYDADFCKVFNAYWGYLDGFGLLLEAKDLDNRYGKICPAGGAPAAAAPPAE